MQYGFTVPNGGPLANPDDVTAIARAVEDLGFHIVGSTDHLVVPRSIASAYPYSDTGKFMPVSAGGDSFLEQLSLLTYVAALTETLRILTSVMVVPHRGAVLAAKTLAILDVLSRSRLIAGCGVGWMAEELDAVDTPPFAGRGRVTDEFLEVFRLLWTETDPAYDGQHVSFPPIGFEPKPVQKPLPPIWVGGEGAAAMRRTARLAEGWYPVSTNPRHPLNTAERFAAGVERMRRVAEEEKRDPATWPSWSPATRPSPKGLPAHGRATSR
jgi:probable F420-dependent oxidoreductase